jgi:flagellar hook-basal body complex protein FliE
MSIETMRSISVVPPELSSGKIDQPGQSTGAGGFAETLGGALQKVDGMQVDADVQAEQVAMGGGNLHEMSLALEKADVSMRLAMKVRTKLIDAYQEIMRMSV